MRDWRDPVVGFGLILHLTIVVVVSALVPLFLGIWLDSLLQTSPFITLLMTVLGITAGVVGVYRNVARVYKNVGGDHS